MLDSLAPPYYRLRAFSPRLGRDGSRAVCLFARCAARSLIVVYLFSWNQVMSTRHSSSSEANFFVIGPSVPAYIIHGTLVPSSRERPREHDFPNSFRRIANKAADRMDQSRPCARLLCTGLLLTSFIYCF